MSFGQVPAPDTFIVTEGGRIEYAPAYSLYGGGGGGVIRAARTIADKVTQPGTPDPTTPALTLKSKTPVATVPQTKKAATQIATQTAPGGSFLDSIANKIGVSKETVFVTGVSAVLGVLALVARSGGED